MFRRRFVRWFWPRAGACGILIAAVFPGVAYAGGMSVTVVDSLTKRPLGGVTVTADARDGAVQSVTTGSDGSVSLENLSTPETAQSRA